MLRKYKFQLCSGVSHINGYLYDCIRTQIFSDINIHSEIKIAISLLRQHLMFYKWCFASLLVVQQYKSQHGRHHCHYN